ncbi:MAG: N-acetylmuramoyl-L-alanine amidase [Myxococcales bacterium]|nr:N-acetylmuramoyl-L-alanine amidase [Myxococcales bacterium]MCB9534375.1 N-acetylmuramoyl-L-alanine amidase [Myxococcales bacterium]
MTTSWRRLLAVAAVAAAALPSTQARGQAEGVGELEAVESVAGEWRAEPDELLVGGGTGADAGDGSGEGEVPPFDAFMAIRTIVIDPGHGGTDSGCVGVAGLPEKELTLKLSWRVVRLLQAEDPTLTIRMTREGDTYPTLEERTALANAVGADVLLSVHFNCAPNGQAYGLETYYLAPDGTVPGDVVPGLEAEGEALPVPGGSSVSGAETRLVLEDLRRASATWWSARLAEELLSAASSATGMASRGVREDRFRVLRGARMPAVVLELGFLTHAREGKRVFTGPRLDGLARGIVVGLRRFDRATETWGAE